MPREQLTGDMGLLQLISSSLAAAGWRVQLGRKLAYAPEHCDSGRKLDKLTGVGYYRIKKKVELL